ncbi:MAG: UDP-N-acetylmuramoyl-L-alanine--D-glutamate ligase [Planctomycetota bacterium]
MIDWKDKRVTVMGLGLFSGGVAVTRFLAARGARVTVTDLKGADELAPSLAAIKDLAERVVLGKHDEADFRCADVVVHSPAVSADSPYLQLARAAGIPVLTEVEIFFQACRGTILGVTGTSGKSTTTALLGAMLAAAGFPTHVGGNIGRSLLADVETIRPSDLVVLELSSFQLEALANLGVSPRGAVVTNLAPNHLDRHRTYENYVAAKKNIILFQKPDDFVVLNADCADLCSWEPRCVNVFLFSRRAPVAFGAFREADRLYLARNGEPAAFLAAGDIPLRGEHNVENVLAAAAAAAAAGAPPAAIARAVRDFKALPHRLELVATVNGIACYNDSKATTPDSAVQALRSFDSPILLIAGGYDKGSDFSAFAREVASRARLAVLIGSTGGKLERLIAEADPDGRARLLRVASLDEAVSSALSLGAPGDVLLLSPACASYDMFTNFEERGDQFTRLVLSRAGYDSSSGT